MGGRVRTFVPVRSFDGMTRLGDSVSAVERRALAEQLAERTTTAAAVAATRVAVVSNDDEVRTWAEAHGLPWIAEPGAGGLSGAAAAGIRDAEGAPWIILHSDLPAIGVDDIRAAAELVADGIVLAPSHDGGTSLVGGAMTDFPFRYGPGSFRRHLTAVSGRATILVRRGLALDLDHPADLAAYRRLGYLIGWSTIAVGSDDHTRR